MARIVNKKLGACSQRLCDIGTVIGSLTLEHSESVTQLVKKLQLTNRSGIILEVFCVLLIPGIRMCGVFTRGVTARILRSGMRPAVVQIV